MNHLTLPSPVMNARHVAERLRESARELAESSSKLPPSQGFGARIAAAVRRRLEPLAAARAATAEGDSFAQKLKKAVQQKSGAKRQKEQAERDRNRYKHAKPRPHTKSD